MDGIESNNTSLDLTTTDLNECNFVELKLKLSEKHVFNGTEMYYRFKLMKWWSQCVLANVKKILVDTRTEEGIVYDVSHINVRDIPDQARVIIFVEL